MADIPERARIWRPDGARGLLCMDGVSTGYVVDPTGEVVLGTITRGAMRARRRRAQHVVAQGESCLWDASARHAGTPYRCGSWDAKLVVLEPPALDELSTETPAATRVLSRRDPVIVDPTFTARFLAFHRSLSSASALAIESELLDLLAWLGGAAPARPSASRPEPGLCRAHDLLVAEPARNVTLGEL